MKKVIFLLFVCSTFILAQKTAEEYLKDGNSKYGLADYRGAVEDYTKAIEINPNYSDAYNNRGLARHLLAEYRNAIEDYDKAIEINPKSADTYCSRGYAKYMMMDGTAIQDYDKAIELDPKHATSYMNRGISKHNDLKDYTGAIQDYSKAIKIIPNFANAYMNRGLSKYFLKKNKESILDFDKAIELNPKIAKAYLHRGNAKYQILDKKGACSDWDKALELGESKAADKIKEFCNAAALVEIKSVKIGKQVWMTENLNVNKFRNGDLIPELKTYFDWAAAAKEGKPAWCYYSNDGENGKKYGKLYNWFAVNDERGLAPEGWHVPTKAEFETLIKSVHKKGNDLKEIGEGEKAGTGKNTSGFSALLAGYRDRNSEFKDLGHLTIFWGSTEYSITNAYLLGLVSYDNNITFNTANKVYGLSVRCLKD